MLRARVVGGACTSRSGTLRASSTAAARLPFLSGSVSGTALISWIVASVAFVITSLSVQTSQRSVCCATVSPMSVRTSVTT